MNKLNPLQELQQKIIKAVPSKYEYLKGLADSERIWDEAQIAITLEDVLIACKQSLYISATGYFGLWKFDEEGYIYGDNLEVKWLLNTPLHLQSDKTISEINKLIK